MYQNSKGCFSFHTPSSSVYVMADEAFYMIANGLLGKKEQLFSRLP